MTKDWSLFKYIRLLVLLFILFIVAVDAWLDRARSTDWNNTLTVVIVPVNPEASEVVDRYIADLNADDLQPIAKFFDREAGKYISIKNSAFKFLVGEELHEQAPELEPNAQWFDAVVWSLRSRYWVYQKRKKYKHLFPDIMLFVNYYDPAEHNRVRHSVGLEKGLYGIVYGFGNSINKKQNHIVIAHELLHTLGASDKYEPSSNQPLFPIGYAERDKQPLYPQSKAELMAGRVPIDAGTSFMPESLNDVVIGPETALEINWLKTL